MKNLYLIKTGHQYWYVLCDEDAIGKFNYACQNRPSSNIMGQNSFRSLNLNYLTWTKFQTSAYAN